MSFNNGPLYICQISSEIYPREVAAPAQKINLWVVIGGSIGGLILLILLGVILWKVCTDFELEMLFYEHVSIFTRIKSLNEMDYVDCFGLLYESWLFTFIP